MGSPSVGGGFSKMRSGGAALALCLPPVPVTRPLVGQLDVRIVHSTPRPEAPIRAAARRN